LKKSVIILIMVMLLSISGFSKKSTMNPQLLEEITNYLNNNLYAVVISRGICANPSYRYKIVIKDAGESKIGWEQLDRGATEFKKGEILVLETVRPKKWGFLLLFRTLDKRKFNTTEDYTEKIKYPATEKEEEKEIEVKGVRKITLEDYYRTRIDFKFHERRYSYTRENIQFILDTMGQGFHFFKNKEDALKFVDEKVGMNNSVEIGMTIADVVKIHGLPERKLKNGNKMVYKYKEWVIYFVNGKVSDVEF
jgi:hypothetical protein